MANVRIYDNGACFMITVNGLMVQGFRTLGDAWRHIKWMYAVAQQQFTVGEKEVPVKEWIDGMVRNGILDEMDGYEQ